VSCFTFVSAKRATSSPYNSSSLALLQLLIGEYDECGSGWLIMSQTGGRASSLLVEVPSRLQQLSPGSAPGIVRGPTRFYGVLEVVVDRDKRRSILRASWPGGDCPLGALELPGALEDASVEHDIVGCEGAVNLADEDPALY